MYKRQPESPDSELPAADGEVSDVIGRSVGVVDSNTPSVLDTEKVRRDGDGFSCRYDSDADSEVDTADDTTLLTRPESPDPEIHDVITFLGTALGTSVLDPDPLTMATPPEPEQESTHVDLHPLETELGADVSRDDVAGACDEDPIFVGFKTPAEAYREFLAHSEDVSRGQTPPRVLSDSQLVQHEPSDVDSLQHETLHDGPDIQRTSWPPVQRELSEPLPLSLIHISEPTRR